MHELSQRIESSQTNAIVFNGVETGGAISEGKLSGLRVAVKDNIAVAGMPMTCASRALENFVPNHDATAVKRLRESGAHIVGKTNLDEFAMGSSTEYSIFGSTNNPHNLTLTAGGSSGGSAAAVSEGLCDMALGSDSGGSVRIPAAFCRVHGFKPSYGRISRYGLTAFCSSMDQIGILAIKTNLIRSAFTAMEGQDALDSKTISLPSPIKGREQQAPRCLVLRDPSKNSPFLDSSYVQILAALDRHGIEYRTHNMDMWNTLVPIYQVLSSAEMSSNLARFDGLEYGTRCQNSPGAITRSKVFGDEVKRRVLMGTYVLSAGRGRSVYDRAFRLRRRICSVMSRIFGEFSFIICPTSPIEPFPLGSMIDNPTALYEVDRYTVLANLCGWPAYSLPLDGFRAMQVIGRYGSDYELLDFGESLNQLA